MKKENKEDFELIKRFFDEEQASSVVSDIKAAERMFSTNAAPLPDQAVLEKIKHEMTQAFAEKRRHESRLYFIRITAAAAVMLITVFAGLKYYSMQPTDTSAIVTGNEFLEMSSLPRDAEIEAQLASIERSEAFLTLDTTNSDSAYVADLESEIEDFGSFWEG
jgi:hypothetical protein